MYAYAFGTSQTFGQDSAYFPANVLGVICTTATPLSPCADPCQVVSMGKGGYIALEFNPPLIDGPGADFIVFENAFRYGNGQVFEEWMVVSASQDGVEWRTFPYDSISGEGLAGRTPTGCLNCTEPVNWQDPTQAGGDAFDLARVGLGWARYIRVEDATRWQPPDRLSADLDGMVAIHQGVPLDLPAMSSGSPEIRDGKIYLPEEPRQVRLWDLLGRAAPFEVSREGDAWVIRGEGFVIGEVITERGMWCVKGLLY
uniref:Lipoprotein n=1 Tax=uncultured Bacteroidota bacterium TaxID=152509 RepID=H5SMR3_9BACT|nr:lipoprotein [uncultured Bacteroidetes bacterium]